MKTAEYWTANEDNSVSCWLCPHQCRITEGKSGLCRVRKMSNGTLCAATYGLISSVAVDPVEKKPLYHFYPGSNIFSVGGWGCNFRCGFCQNWSISQQIGYGHRTASPVDIIASALNSGSSSIAYTYNEPLVGYEYVLDCCVEAANKGLRNVLVTNGYINPEPAANVLEYVDGLNVDIKSMDNEFYLKNCSGSLGPVLDFCVQARAADCHLELTNLVIPGENDSDDNFKRLGAWISENLGKGTPLHLSAYHPQYKFTKPATGVNTLIEARAILTEMLDYVYIGNVQTSDGQDTTCPSCGSILIKRRYYETSLTGLNSDGSCIKCGRTDLGIII